MASKKKSWVEKLNQPQEIQIKRIEGKFADIPEGGLMLIATPKIVENYLREIPEGKSVDVKTIRQDLAAKFEAEYTCPLTTGIFLRIVAEAEYERYLAGTPINEVAPFWRAIDKKSNLSKKLSFGYEFVQELREKEGIEG